MGFEQIRAEASAGIGRISLYRPQRQNALTIRMRQEVAACLDDWRDNPLISVAVLRGEGSGFCGGFDREEMLSLDPAVRKAVYDSSREYFRALAYFPKPLLASIEGFAFGAGLDSALLCDVRIAAEGASFAHPEVKFGAPPLYTSLRAIVGEGWARDLCLTGRRLYAADALRIGLVTHVCAPEDLAAVTDTVARRIAEAPLETLKVAKSFFVSAPGSLFEESLVREHDEPFASIYSQGAPKGETQK